MAKLQRIQTDFSAGEYSPRLFSRVDLDNYQRAARTMENAYPYVHGGARRRPGLVFVEEVKDSNDAVRLLPFELSRTLSYILVMNDGVIQFIKEGVFVENSLSPGTRYEIAHPYTDAELSEIKYVQLQSTLILAHPSHPPKQLTRQADDNWTLQDFDINYYAVTDFTYENAYLRLRIVEGSTAFEEGDQFEIDTSTNPATVTTTNINTGTMVGNGTIAAIFLKPTSPANEVYTFTAVNTISSLTDVQYWEVEGDTVGDNLVATWRTGNYPGAVTIYNQRLYFGGTPLEPQRIWGSVVGQYNNFSLGPNDADAVDFTAVSDSLDQIIHLVAARALHPLSFGAEFSAGGGAANITPSNILLTNDTSHGSNDVRPIKIGQEILFIEAGGRKVRAINYSLTEDRNVAPDITLLAEHVTQSGIVASSFAARPDYIAYFVRNDGQLATLILERDFQVVAWSRQITNGGFLDVATIPNLTLDQTYVCVERVIDGDLKKYVEYFDYIENAQTDSALFGSAPGSPTDTWGGLEHLEGETVQVVADGNVHPDVVVTSGQIVLDYEVETIEAGLGYTTRIDTLHPEVYLNDGTAQGRKVAIGELYVRVQDTVGLVINDEEIAFREVGNNLDEPIPPFTGRKRVLLRGWTRDQVVRIEQRVPKPMQILAVIMEVSIND